jgi:hypothetical protein
MSLPNYISIWGASWNFTSLYHYIKNENVFLKNPEIFPTQVSLSPEQSTLLWG